MEKAVKAKPEAQIESLQQKIEEYERWFRTLDNQLHALERERQKFSAVVNHTDAGFLVLNSHLQAVWANKIFAEFMGSGSAAVFPSEKKCNQVLCGGQKICSACPAFKLFLSGGVAHGEMRLEVAGRTRQIYATAMPVKSPDGRIEEAMVMLQDITDLEVLRRSEEELKTTLSRLSATLESTADGILMVNQEGKITSFNRKFAEMWRIPQKIAAARDDDQTLAFVLDQLKDPAKLKELYAQPEAESFDLLEFKDGRTLEQHSQPQRIGEKIVGRVWSFRDVTERSRLENQLRQSQKMEAVGQLAGGIAHDFNNLLTIIIGYSDFLLERSGNDERLRKEAEGIRKAAERASALTRQLLAFSRQQVLQPKVLDLNAVVADMEKMLKRLIGENVELSTVPQEDLWRVKADPGQLEQVIMNLAVNARDAMPKGGKLIIRTGNAELDEEFAREHIGSKPGQYAMLSVTDAGCGMDAEVQKRIFEPFYTTKEKGKGTGLGLSTVYGIVKQSGGYIAVESKVGEGSVFSIYLPKAEKGAGEPITDKFTLKSPRGTETILLAEDEDDVRLLAAEILFENGYVVLEARNGREAVAICERHSGPIHLLVADVVMPGMGGPEAAQRLTVLRPEMKMLFVSGYTDNPAVLEKIMSREVAFMQKPFTPDGLARKVREVLDAGKKQKAAAKA